ncbi:MAG: nitronate monooxygenase [Leptospiraceae bacterium]|nr:nitronate monooxygenase [Leptospiraceae bacterium]
MRISTPISDMLGIELPILGAPMFLVSYPELVVAVSEAGGIGCFPALNYRTTEALRDGLQEIRSKTKKPIGVNLILYKEHNPDWPKQFQVCLEENVELIITSLGSPRTVVQEAKSIGASVFCDVTTLRHANVVAKAGADALIAVAQGAGGHAGNISPFALIPQLKKEVGLPVIASGAISDGHQMAAALALGADAAYIGTRLIATPEARASDPYKQMLLESTAEDIVYTAEISGIPANWIKKSVENAQAPSRIAGDEDEYKRWRDIWSAGHGVSQIGEIRPAGEIVRSMAAQYEEIRKSLPALRATEGAARV